VFDDDLERGVEVEDRVLARIRKKYPTAVRIPGKFPAYDIWVAENETKIEVKHDPKAEETGNLVVEVYHAKPSGLLTTEADFWIFDTGIRDFWITPAKIWECVVRKRLSPSEIQGPGDTYSKTVYLVRIELIAEFCDQASA